MPVTSKLHDIFIKREKHGRTYSSIAKEYGVSRQYIFSVIKRLHDLDYQKKLDAVNPENMNELILPVRVVTFLKKKKLYDVPITYFLCTVQKSDLESCANLSIKSLMEMLRVLEKTPYVDFLQAFSDIIEEIRKEIKHV
jgi:hypothetical protein|tara:strand:+ start:641 stop:1057 length:417 start_codon:yes stop_codon:yes gene_type:complete